MGLRINLRLNDKKDKDIIDALSNAKNLSKEVRKLLRQAVSGVAVAPQPYQPEIPKAKVLRHKPVEAPKVEAKGDEIADLEANLLANFGVDLGDDE